MREDNQLINIKEARTHSISG